MKYFNFKFLIFFLALAMAIPPAWAEEELLVCNGTTTNAYVPIAYAGAYGTSYPTQQMIYPADMLSDMSGTEIKGITFYTSSAIVMNQGSFDVKLGETSQSTYSSATAITGLTTVASAQVPVAGGTELVINFDNNYTYNGGNLVVEIYINSNLYPSYASQNFYGQSQENYTSFGYGTRQKFLPKATFTYEGELQPYAAKVSPASIDFGKTSPNTSLTQELTIKNNGANAFTPSLSGLSAPFSTTYTPSELASGQTATIPIVFTPTTTGDFTATLAVTSTDGNIATVNVPLSGTSVNEETIAEGTATNSYIPLYGYYYDNKQINQMIYPESMLTKIQGKNIKSMTFYGSNLNLQGGAYSVKVGTTDQNNFTSRVRITEGLTIVASIADGTQSGTELTILFDNPFTYDGGNLLIDFEITTEGNNYPSNSFTGAYAAAASFSSYTNYSSSDLNDDGVYAGGDIQDFLPKVTIAFEDAIVSPSIEMSPETLTVNDAEAGTLTITGTNVEGNINASLANNTDWYLNPASFSNAGGTASVSYTGRALSASNIVTATAANDNTVTASTTVNYVADLYIVTDNGMTGQWDFNNGTHMTNNDGTYTANFTADRDNTFILFARKLGDGVNWNTRLVFGPNSNGDWVMNGDNATGNIDLNDDDPIQFPTAGTYTITINSDGSFSINKVLPQVATPEISPASGSFTDAQQVTITCATDGATIYYTTDGSVPTTSSTQYTAPFTVSETTTVKAIAAMNGMTDSEVATASYTISEPVATPTFSPAGGNFDAVQTVTINCATDGATIYYTTDGSVPTTSSTQYTGPISVASTMTIKAIAVKEGMVNSAVATATYNIEITSGDLTVADGTETTTFSPIYPSKFDNAGWVQMLYPSTLLTQMDGSTIKSITYYPNALYCNGMFDVYIGEIDDTNISTELTNLQMAAEGVTVTKNNTNPITINIADYNYNGGNLVIKTVVTTAYSRNNTTGSNSGQTNFLCQDVGGKVEVSYSYNNSWHKDFLPKTTFSYEGASSSAKPTGELSDDEALFGNIIVNTSKSVSITITNTGEVDFTPVVTLNDANGVYSVSNVEAIATGESQELTITFNPTTAGTYDGTVTVTIGRNTYTINLLGHGVEAVDGYAVEVEPEDGFVDFGWVNYTNGENSQRTVTIRNMGTMPVTPTLSDLAAPFTTDYQPTTIATGETAVITITFTPTEEKDYTADATVTYGNATLNATQLSLYGRGAIEEAYSDEAFFSSIWYTWTDDNGDEHRSNLGEIATDPNQIIAMLKTVYTNRNIPGNLKRGYTAAGVVEELPVNYPAVGRVTSSSNGYAYTDSYGWGIGTSKPILNYDNSGRYYLDPSEYRPKKEGVTLVMIEVQDGTNYSGNTSYQSTSSYDDLKTKVGSAFKSARMITHSKKSGSGEDAGTLFKIDADKLNRFFFLAKGQLRVADNSWGTWSCYYPHLSGSTWSESNGDLSGSVMAPFYHMFEQFSPNQANSGTSAQVDVYKDLINMESYKVVHDCVSVPFIGGNHEFNMYGVESTSDDCQDVRDMMFFVPEYRMKSWSNRDASSSEKFVNYYEEKQPTLGLYVIHQNEITGDKQDNANVYDLNLSWKSNLLDFLPADEGQYFLYRVITDANGNKSYEPVVQVTESGEPILDANGDPIPVTLDPNQTTYIDHIAMQEIGQEVTYVVQGQDATQFLSLQMSNEESFIIPGTDETLKLTLKLTNDYSRFDPKTERNYYSNELQVTNNMSPYVSADDLAANNAQFTIYRYYGEGENEVEIPVATLTPVAGQMKLNITWANQRGNSTDAENYYSWINMPNADNVTYSVNNNVVAFDNFRLFDNFYESVADNNHPSQYRYQVEFSYGDQTAHSNKVSVYIHKTDMDVQGYTQSNIDNDDLDHSLDATARYIDEQVKYSSKQEILRYDAFRWKEGSENERKIMTNSTIDATTLEVTDTEVAPTGEADNGGNQYTLKMDGNTQGAVGIDLGDTKPVTFMDAAVNQEAGMYYYAPVVETFTGRSDYNTYGAPVQQTGVATIQAKVAQAVISKGSFKVGNEPTLYAHYNVTLDLSQLLIPSEDDPFKDYDLYKVRVWRQVDVNLLNEEVFSGNNVGRNRAERITGDFLMEEVNNNTSSDPCLGREGVHNDLGISDYKLGSNENLTQFHSNWTKSGSNEIMGTFGAKKLRSTVQEGDSVIDELPMHFIVRAYYTRTANLEQASNGRGVDVTADSKYYIAEYQFDYTLTRDNTATGLSNVIVDRKVTSVTYYNLMGQQSSKPFEGVNIVVTRYSDGTTSTAKVIQ